MDLETGNDKRREFCGIIASLSEKQDESSLKDLYLKLRELYDDPSGEPFRHFYSDISSALQQISTKNQEGCELTVTNLEEIKKKHFGKSEEKSENNFHKVFNKLLDHVHLENSRMLSLRAIEAELSDNREELKTSMENCKTLENKTEELKNKTADIQKHFISILGIFAGIIMVFNGGLSFTTAVLSSIANANIFKLLSLCFSVGLVLLNVFWGLFYYIDRLTGSDNNKNRRSELPILVNLILIIGTAVFACLSGNE